MKNKILINKITFLLLKLFSFLFLIGSFLLFPLTSFSWSPLLKNPLAPLGQTQASLSPYRCFNGIIHSIVEAPEFNRVLVGGSFDQVGLCLGHGAPLNLSNGAVATNFNPALSQINGTLSVSIPDGVGGWYIGGDFTKVGNLSRLGVARIDSSGLPDLTFVPNGNFVGTKALALSPSELFIGGEFNDSPEYGAVVDTTTAEVIPAFEKRSFNDHIYVSLSDGAGGWYVGGRFTKYGNREYSSLIKILASGEVDSLFNPQVIGEVSALFHIGNDLYVGGSFTSIGGETRNRIAKINAATGALSSWNPGANGEVRTFALNGNTLYVGGSFTSIGGETRNRLASFDITTGNLTPWNPNLNNTARTLALYDNNLYAGGDFTLIGAETRNRIASFNTTTGDLNTWNPNSSASVSTLLVDGNTLYVGGSFSTLGGTTRNSIASFDLTTGNLTPWDPINMGGNRNKRNL